MKSENLLKMKLLVDDFHLKRYPFFNQLKKNLTKPNLKTTFYKQFKVG